MREVRKVLTEGVCWKFLSLLFQRPTDATVEAANTLLEELPPDLKTEAAKCVDLLRVADVRASHHSVLGSACRISPCESTYHGPGEEGLREKGTILGDIAGFYKAFEFDPSKEILEAPDHVAVELAFMSYVKLKEAYALTIGSEGAYRVCRDAGEKFLSEHLLVWIHEFIDCMSEESTHEFYKKAAHLLQLFLEKGTLVETFPSGAKGDHSVAS